MRGGFLPVKSVTRLVILLAIVCSFALPGWWLISSEPSYQQRHKHDSVPPHVHLHTHDGNSSHGHEHVLSFIKQTHSHPHHHDHRHDENLQSEKLVGLTEIGHSHQAAGMTGYWGRAELTGDKIVISFQSSDSSTVLDTWPLNDRVQATINNGNDIVDKLTLTLSDEKFVGTVSRDYFFFPTHTISISGVQFSGDSFDARLPLLDSSHAPPATSESDPKVLSGT